MNFSGHPGAIDGQGFRGRLSGSRGTLSAVAI
jgi:hypothetical protein